MIPFNKPPYIGTEMAYIKQSIESNKISGDGVFGQKCHQWFENHLGCQKALMTPSCTHALEMAALLIDIKPGDEVIMPSYTFVSTANAFALRGAKIVFVDIRPDTLNIDERKIEAAITSRTKAIVPVHYAGVACEMDTIMKIAERHRLFVIEDAAQGILSSYKEKPLGSIGHFGCISFHETKNITAGGEGGALLVNDERFIKRAEIIREKGTNRAEFFRGEVDKYTWVDIGSSYLPSELQCAYLYAQLQHAQDITNDRKRSWQYYFTHLTALQDTGKITLPSIPPECRHNAHMFFLKTSDEHTRDALIRHLKRHDIHAVFHYIPLHTSVAGKRYGYFHGTDRHTTNESKKLLRLPLYYNIKNEDLQKVVEHVHAFFA
jgi:dTDP-4-amino-4,6-dideoxygalactose transaminase